MLISVSLFAGLGVWQLNRAQEKKELAKKVDNINALEQLNINAANIHLLSKIEIEHRKVQIEGRFETDYQFYLDNKKHNGINGYQIITPFLIKNSKQRILVNRGWVAMQRDRNNLPLIETTTLPVLLVGKIKFPPKKAFRPGISKPADSLGGIWLYLDMPFFSSLSGYALFPGEFLLDKNEQHGFVRQWPEFKANTELHIGYAVQWFAFALFSLMAYISFGFRKNERTR